MKVYTLSYLGDPSDDVSCGFVIGVYKSLEDAQAAMNEEFETAKIEHEIDENDLGHNFDIKISNGDYECSIYHFGSMYEWRISEFEI